MAADRVDAVVNLCKRRGFVFQSSEIYGGSRSAWDYGPLGVELKENIKRAWWQRVVRVATTSSAWTPLSSLAPQVWAASGHLEAFADPLTECRVCHRRYRADQLLEEYEGEEGPGRHPRRRGLRQLRHPRRLHRAARLQRSAAHLHRPGRGRGRDPLPAPETAQGIFVNFANVMNAARKKPPFGIGQVGKSFRNEITPGNFIFRTREFEQMEMEFFVPRAAMRNGMSTGSRSGGTGTPTWV